MASSLNLTVLAPDNIILASTSVSRVRIGLSDGAWLSIYPGHAPLLAELRPGILEYTQNGKRKELTLSAGVLQVENNHISIFVQQVQSTEDYEYDTNHIDQFDMLTRKLLESLTVQEKPDHNHN